MSSDKEDLRVLELKDLVSQLNITISSQNETIKISTQALKHGCIP